MSWLDWGKPHNWAEDSLGLRLGPTADELGDAQQVPVLTCRSSHRRLGRIGQHPFPGLASTVLGTNTPSTVRAFVVVTGIASYTTSYSVPVTAALGYLLQQRTKQIPLSCGRS